MWVQWVIPCTLKKCNFHLRKARQPSPLLSLCPTHHPVRWRSKRGTNPTTSSTCLESPNYQRFREYLQKHPRAGRQQKKRVAASTTVSCSYSSTAKSSSHGQEIPRILPMFLPRGMERSTGPIRPTTGTTRRTEMPEARLFILLDRLASRVNCDLRGALSTSFLIRPAPITSRNRAVRSGEQGWKPT